MTLIICIGLICVCLFLWKGQHLMTKMELYRPYNFEVINLSNGLEVLLVHDKSLPYISYEILFKGGTKKDPVDQEGLTAVLVDSMDKGTRRRTAVQLANDLELLGSEFTSELGRDYVSFSVEALSWLSDKVLEIFSEMITQTVFKDKEFDRVKQKIIGNIKRSSENFNYYAARIFNKYLFDSHPYGFYGQGKLDSLQRIKKIDVQRLYQETFRPDQAVLAVAGRIPEDVLQQLERTFGQWQVNSVVAQEKKKSANTIPVVDKTELLVVDHPSAIQSEIWLGHISVSSSHKDYLALKPANLILGSNGMGSRLMQRIRVQKGLTYHIFSYFDAKKELGAFKSGMSVRNARVGDALLESIAVMAEFHKNGITEEELKEAQSQINTRFIKSTSTVEGFAGHLLYLSSQNLPYHFAESYLYNINTLNVDRVNAAVKQHLHPDKLKILVFSKADDITPQLQDYQPFTIKDYKDFL